MKILFATSEIFPLIKTGGLADVSCSLPRALRDLGQEVTVILPGYRSLRQKLGQPDRRYRLQDAFLHQDITLAEYTDTAVGIPMLLVESDALFDRDGGPYERVQGAPWHDNADRFAQFCRAVECLLRGAAQDLQTGADYPAGFDVVHCNDWQTGLIPALLRHNQVAIKTVFTIHNLAYQGIFDYAAFQFLKLPAQWWQLEALEFYGNFSFLKAGIVYADWVTTVSPTYAEEIQQEPMACGMAGLLQYHRHKLVGILNGADYEVWNPATDPNIPFHFDAQQLANKVNNKLDLQRAMGLRLSKSAPLIGLVSRLVEQKGIDWVVDAISATLGEKLQWVVLGNGNAEYEAALLQLAEQHPKTVSVTLGYDEALAHQIEAGCDLFAMPSRYEPCGLNQIYSLRYGTLPIVRRTGGLADTVVDATDESIAQGTATGFVFEQPSSADFMAAVRRATALYSKRRTWEKLAQTAMAQCFDWQHSAQSYLELYQQE